MRTGFAFRLCFWALASLAASFAVQGALAEDSGIHREWPPAQSIDHVCAGGRALRMGR